MMLCLAFSNGATKVSGRVYNKSCSKACNRLWTNRSWNGRTVSAIPEPLFSVQRESWRRQYLPRRMEENEWYTSSYQSLYARCGGLELHQQSGRNHLSSKWASTIGIITAVNMSVVIQNEKMYSSFLTLLRSYLFCERLIPTQAELFQNRQRSLRLVSQWNINRYLAVFSQDGKTFYEHWRNISPIKALRRSWSSGADAARQRSWCREAGGVSDKDEEKSQVSILPRGLPECVWLAVFCPAIASPLRYTRCWPWPSWPKKVFELNKHFY